MNAPECLPLPDIQSQVDPRNLAIDGAGVKGVRYPFTLKVGAVRIPTIGKWTMTVALPAHVKGTHMSRFIELLDAGILLDAESFRALGVQMLGRLGAASGRLEVCFPYFVTKFAPVSRVSSLLDYEVIWSLSLVSGNRPAFRTKVIVPATSLCPCSKEISAYGAHNQRSHITIDAEINGAISIEELVGMAERSASCEVYGLLKRGDEKYVTERAYDNPKFVEDLVRDVALELNRDARIGSYTIEAENFESIHNHSAYARIVRSAVQSGHQ